MMIPLSSLSFKLGVSLELDLVYVGFHLERSTIPLQIVRI